MAQSWHDLLFAHWPVPVEQLRPALPPFLPLDTFAGRAWLGVIPFRMTRVRLRGMPPLPWLSAFPELNVRTYVTAGGKPGVFFFSLDAGNRVAVTVARRWFRLPYYRARMSVTPDQGGIRYTSQRVHRGAAPAAFDARYAPVGAVFRASAGSLDRWLTERYCLYTTGPAGRLYRAEIHHAPWPLQRAEAAVRSTMTAPLGIALPEAEALLHFARRLDVVVWPPRPVAG